MMTHDISLTPAQRLIVALDVLTVDEALMLVRRLTSITTFKVGYWLLFDPGLHLLLDELRAADKQIFFDAKLNDIPETVKHGVASAARHGVDFITVHSDEPMLNAAMEGKGSSAIKVMAVTVLTSTSSVGSHDRFRAGFWNALATGCDGMIMAPSDLDDRIMRHRSLEGHKLIATPGIRMAGNLMHDHKRTGTPETAIRNGADYIIVGRPIIRAADPAAEVEQFIAHIARANV